MLFPRRSAVHVDVDLARRLHADRRALGAQVSGRRAGRLDVGREAEADVAPLLQRVLLLLAETLVVEDLHRLLEGVGRCHVLIGHAVGVDVGHLVAAKDVAAAQLDGVHVHLPRGDVEKYFAREGFVLPRAAIGGKARRVGEHRLVVEARLRNPVGAREEHSDRRRGQHRVRRRIGADILNVVDVGGEDVALFVERHPDVAVDVAGLPGRHQVLPPVLDPFQGTGHLAGGQHDAHVFAHRDDLLAEATAGVAHDDPDVLRRDPEQSRAERAQFVRSLRRCPHREFARGRLPLDDKPACLDRNRRIDLLVDVRRGGVGSRREGFLVGRGSAHPARDVVGVGLVHNDVRVDRLGEVGDGGQGFVVDIDQLDGVLGEVARFGDDKSNRVADELRLALGQRGSRRVGNVLARNRVPGLLHVWVQVIGHEHRVHAGQRQRRGGVDTVDPGSGKRAAHEACMQHAWPRHIVDEGPVAGQQPRVLHPLDPCPRVAGCDCIGHGKVSNPPSWDRYESLLSKCPASLSDTRFSPMSIWHSHRPPGQD